MTKHRHTCFDCGREWECSKTSCRGYTSAQCPECTDQELEKRLAGDQSSSNSAIEGRLEGAFEAPVFKWPAILSMIFLLLAVIDRWPYGFYTILRLVVCGSAIYLALQASSLEKNRWVWLMGGVAILFNPVIPVHLDRDLWLVLDYVTALIFAISVITVQRHPLRWTSWIPVAVLVTLSGLTVYLIIVQQNGLRQKSAIIRLDKTTENIPDSSEGSPTSSEGMEQEQTRKGVDSIPDQQAGIDFVPDPARGAKRSSTDRVNKQANTPAPKEEPSDSGAVRSYFTLGSPKEEVLEIQGTPTRISGNSWWYELSEVQFDRSQRVRGYWNLSDNLRVRILPSGDGSVARARGYFTIRSIKDEVLEVQGIPNTNSG